LSYKWPLLRIPPCLQFNQLKLIATERYGIHNVVVWGENSSESVHFLHPIRRYEKYNGFLRSYSKTEDDADKAKKLRDIALWLNLKNADTVSLDDVAAVCDEPNLQRSVSLAAVVLCTLNSAGSQPLRKLAQSRFELAVLDEASQCSEAEFYIATTFPGVKRIVLVGDPRQLPATVICQACEAAKYGESFLSHVLDYRYV
jgi:superfamily I DNA and/or RNA helicase